MKNKFSNLTNDELLSQLRINLDENELIFQEVINREELGTLVQPKDPIWEKLARKS